MVTEIAGD